MSTDADQVLTDNIPALLSRRNADAEERVARSGFNDPVAHALGSFARAAEGGGGASFADPGSELKSFDPKSAVARFVITTDARDRAGDTVVPHGCKGRLARYEKNPVVFFGHKSGGMPVGSAVGPDGHVCLEFDEHRVVSPVKFHLKTLESEQVCALVAAKELRTASIGFIPLKAKFFKRKSPEDGDGTADDRPRNEVTFEPYVTYRFEEWELYEWSIVAVPMNADCVACRLSRGIGGKALADPVRRYLEPFAAPARAWSAGADLPAAPPRARGRKAVAEAVRGQADSVRSLEAKVESLARLVEGVASSVQRLLVNDPAPAPASEPAVRQEALAPASPPDLPAAGSDSLALLREIGVQMARVREHQEANAAALRRVTGRVD